MFILSYFQHHRNHFYKFVDLVFFIGKIVSMVIENNILSQISDDIAAVRGFL